MRQGWGEAMDELFGQALDRLSERQIEANQGAAFLPLIEREMRLIIAEMAAEDEAKELREGTAQVQPAKSARRL